MPETVEQGPALRVAFANELETEGKAPAFEEIPATVG
jgi:hypothetical protein